MMITVTLPPDIEEQVQQRVAEEGKTVEDWLERVVKQELKAPTTPRPSLQDTLTPEEWVRQFREWSHGHDRTTPLLSDEDISRENNYPDRI